MKTKERILQEALILFADDGYEAVSVQNIADKLGITKGALYRHYKNKRDIFDSIIERMNNTNLERAQELNLPSRIGVASTSIYTGKNPIDAMVEFVDSEFHYWTEDTFASKFRKMLTLEQYRDWEMSYLYQNYLAKGVVTYIEDYFSTMVTYDVLKDCDPRVMALELYSPVFLMMSMYDVAEDRDDVKEKLQEHLDRYKERYALCWKDKNS